MTHLGDLSSRSAVLASIEEFDRLGRAEFLRRYGFGQARNYFLAYEGRRYDSKAICGAAHGFEHPTEGPLKPDDFSGGDATVRVKLEELGFSVEVLDGPEPAGDNAPELAAGRVWSCPGPVDT